MHKYEIVIYWDVEDSVFVAKVPELPGCSAHGETPQIALQHVEEAVQLWIDTAREFGDPVPEPRGRTSSSPGWDPLAMPRTRPLRLG